MNEALRPRPNSENYLVRTNTRDRGLGEGHKFERDRLPSAIFFTTVAVLMGTGVVRPLRYGFPVAATVVALILVFKSPARYLSFSMWMWFLTPFVRRIIDYSLGWSEPSLTLLAPYLVSGVCVLPLANWLARPSMIDANSPQRVFPPVFVVPLLGIAMGILPGLYHYAPAAVASELLNWSIPILFAWYIALQPETWYAFRDTFMRTLQWALLAVGGYGIFQFALAPVWDAFWMTNVDANSIGQPLPMQIRVFSTMNSPAVLALALVSGLLFWLANPAKWSAVGAVLSSVTLILSQVRTAWIIFFVGIALLMRMSSTERIRTVVTLVALLLACASLVVAVGNRASLQQDLLQRAATLGSLSHDESAEDRVKGYGAAFAKIAEHPAGYGLGAPDSMLKTPQVEIALHDNVVAAGFLELGVLGGLIYFCGIAIMLRIFVASWCKPISRFSVAAASAGIGLVFMLYLASTVVGPSGVFTWLLLGLCQCESGQVTRKANLAGNCGSVAGSIGGGVISKSLLPSSAIPPNIRVEPSLLEM